MPNDSYKGLLFIGDPHLASRVPGFRCDEYPRTVLKKLAWCLKYARENKLLPAILGDLFHWPRDNANWLLVELMALLDGEVLAIYGNHDCATNELSDDDTLQVIVRARRLRLVDADRPWRGWMGSRLVIVGGSSWGQRLPESFEIAEDFLIKDKPLVFWMAHHDIRFAGYESSGRIGPGEIPGVDMLVNGHIHMALPDAIAGTTAWINPGNIARVKFSDGTRERVPSVLRVDIDAKGVQRQIIEVPHERFAKVFHIDAAKTAAAATERSLFVAGLNELRTLRTQGGGGLTSFLKKNIDRYPAAVQTEILELAKEVVPDGKVEK
jgi:hypothetical protein